jgi:sugar-phosphatase
MYVAEVVAYWFEQSPWTGPSQPDVVASILSRVGDLVESEGVLMSGALRALDLAAQRGPIALASSTPMALIERCLDHFSLRSRFVSLHSAEIEPYGKPHPGVFLECGSGTRDRSAGLFGLRRLGAGVIAAKAGRMTCVAVPAPDDRADAVFSIADVRLDDLADLAETWLDERFAVGD